MTDIVAGQVLLIPNKDLIVAAIENQL